MTHMIEMLDGKAQIAWAGETPWHGLGTKVPADLSPGQMQKAAGLDWKVEKKPMIVATGPGQEPIRIPDRKALVRSSDNKVLDIVGEDWIPVQNDDAFNFFHEYCAAGDMNMEVAGSLNDGKNIWVLARVNESFDILGQDQIDSYLLFSNPHQYGKTVEVRFTPVRVVCNNTLTMSLQAGSVNYTKLNHRQEFNAEAVKMTLGIATENMAKYKEVAEFLSNKRYTPESFINYINSVFPKTTGKAASTPSYEELSRTGKMIYDVVDQQPGADMAPGTWWNAYNALTFYTDHIHGSNANNRLNNAWFGGNAKRKVNALNKAVEFAEAA